MRPAAQAVAEVPDPVAYVTNQGGGVTVLNARTLKQLDEIAVGKDPRGLAVTPDGRWLLTANQGSADVSVIDTGTRKEIKRIAVEGALQRVASVIVMQQLFSMS